MAFNDPIAELLCRMRNAQAAQHRYVDIYLSKMRLSIVKILKEKGYIANFLVNESTKKMRIFFKYNAQREGILRKLKRVSTPGRRKYVGCSEIPYVLSGIGSAVISTSKGVMDDEMARKLHVGGELLFYVW